ncbi:MAG: hypothetical protein IT380_05980 [Myxococcales bacterium]|nr:hypothetical protein [Myxococcales bacterium]
MESALEFLQQCSGEDWHVFPKKQPLLLQLGGLADWPLSLADLAHPPRTVESARQAAARWSPGTRDQAFGMVHVLMTKGDRVRMSDSLKTRLRGKCGEAGRHLGPFDPGDAHECWGCSSAHVEEFGDGVGIVQGLTDYNDCEPTDSAYDPSKTGPEVDVRWQPSNLRYAYRLSDLELIGSGP